MGVRFLRFVWINFFLLFVLSPIVKGQQSYYFENYSREDGLAENFINAITSTHDGFIWIGTVSGVSRFDGKRFKNYQTGLTDFNEGRISWLYEDSDNQLWMTDYAGLTYYLPHLDRFVRVDLNKAGGAAICGKINENDNGEVVVAHRNGLCFVDKKSHELQGFVPISEIIPGITSLYYMKWVSDEEVYLGSQSHVFKYNHKAHTFIELFESGEIKEIVKDKKGRNWFVTMSQVLIEEDGRFVDYKDVYEIADPVGIEDFRAGVELKSGDILIGTDTEGFLQWDLEKDTVVHVRKSPANNLGASAVWAIYEDSFGNLWTGSYRHGISLSHPLMNRFDRFPNETAPPFGTMGDGPISSFIQINDTLMYVANDGSGLYELNPKTKQLKGLCLDRTTPLKILHISFDGNQTLFLSTWQEGMWRYNIATRQFSLINFEKEYGIKSPLHTFLSSMDLANNLWVMPYNDGLEFVSLSGGPSMHISKSTPELALLSDDVTSIETDLDGTVWVGQGNGITCFRLNEDNSPVKVAEFSKEIGGFDGIAIQDFLFDENQVLIAAKNGLHRYDRKTKSMQSLKNQNAYFSEDVRGLLRTSTDNEFWIIGQTRVVKFDQVAKKLVYFSKDEGLGNQLFVQRAHLNGLGDKVYAGGVGGFVSFSAALDESTSSVPQIYFDEFEVDYKTVDFTNSSILDGPISLVPSIKTEYSSKVLTFQLGVIDFMNQDKITYEYYLEGHDAGWKNLGNNRSISLSELDPGDYKLHARARSVHGILSSELTKTITIVPPFYMTWWFRVLEYTFGAVVIFLIFQWRAMSIKKSNRILEYKVKIRTQEIALQKEELQAQQEELLSQNELIESQNDEILEVNKELTDGLAVGEIVQSTVMPPVNELNNWFLDSAVLLRQRDRVGGDFYWFREINGSLFIAIGDCTGHGVAGGLLTMVGVNLFNEVVATSPGFTAAEILDRVNLGVIRTLQQNKASSNSRDGMDVVVLKIDLKTKVMQVAGAVNSVYILPSSGEELIDIKGDLFSLGIPHKELKKFKNTTYQLTDGDCLVCSTDGIIDQLREDDFKRFSSRRLKEMISNSKAVELSEFVAKVEKEVDQWRETEGQTDDMLLFAIRV